MIQAILITAYKDIEHLKKIVGFFDNDFKFYIHIDVKSEISADQINYLASVANVAYIEKKWSINWGSFNHLKAILYLTNLALQNRNVHYLHLISGQDFPVKKLSDFKSFFNLLNKNSYIDCLKIEDIGWSGNNGLDRIQYYNFHNWLDTKNLKSRSILNKFSVIQKKIGLKRKLAFSQKELYGGSTWWSLPRETANYVVQFSKQHRRVLNKFRHTLCSEEFYFQSVLKNSSNSFQLDKSNLRYIDWNARNGSNPSFLDLEDYQAIKSSDAFFARKFHEHISKSLLNKILEENTA